MDANVEGNDNGMLKFVFNDEGCPWMFRNSKTNKMFGLLRETRMYNSREYKDRSVPSQVSKILFFLSSFFLYILNCSFYKCQY